MKNVRSMNQLTAALLIAALVVGICYLGIFLFPDSPINPFRPQVLALVPTLTASPTGTATPPPTWTPTPIGSPSTPRPTFTPEPTETPHPTRTPTVIPTATIDPRIPTRSTFKYTNTQPVLRA